MSSGLFLILFLINLLVSLWKGQTKEFRQSHMLSWRVEQSCTLPGLPPCTPIWPAVRTSTVCGKLLSMVSRTGRMIAPLWLGTAYPAGLIITQLCARTSSTEDRWEIEPCR